MLHVPCEHGDSAITLSCTSPYLCPFCLGQPCVPSCCNAHCTNEITLGPKGWAIRWKIYLYHQDWHLGTIGFPKEEYRLFKSNLGKLLPKQNNIKGNAPLRD